MSVIAAVRGVLPEHCYAQEELTAGFASLVGLKEHQLEMLATLHRNAGVRHRNLALPLEDYAETTADFGRANDAFIRVATDLGARAIDQALQAAGLTPGDVDLLVTTTITGLAVPSLDARLMAELPLREDLRRLPLVGLGCVGGAAGIARVHEWLVGHPDGVAVLLAVELCSLTLQQNDPSPANLVASGLFGDGAAAVVMVGDRAAQRICPDGTRVLGSRSRLYPQTQRAMGWDVGATGLRIVLGAEVPDLVRANVGGDVDHFLSGHDLNRSEIEWWVCHPGGPKVLTALAQALEIPDEALGVTWRSLASIGNLSSASVLWVLADTLREVPPDPGSFGVLMAMGPGFCMEAVLLQAGGSPA